MALTFNIRHLEHKNLELQGQMALEELDLEPVDIVVHPQAGLTYDIEIQKFENNILVQGSLSLPLKCECVRCLKSFPYQLELPDWSCLLPLQGEDAVPIINDTVDLTPYLREDMLLNFPQHPLCEPECDGIKLPAQTEQKKQKPSGAKPPGESVWTALDKLKLEE
jgi:uncharacterized protein